MVQAGHIRANAKLALGTAQFGMPYGILNDGAGAVPPVDVAAILALAWQCGVDMLDTAIAYGNADEIIAAARPIDASFACVTKMRPVAKEGIGVCVEEIIRARAVLRIPAFYAVLLHRTDDLLGPDGVVVARALEDLHRSGVCERIGVSVYDPATLDAVVDLIPADVVQLPLNVLDQRFVRSGAIERLKRRGAEVHVRSAFLQGILLAKPDAVPDQFPSVHLAAYHAERRRAGLSPAACALRFVLACPGVDRIVIGIDSLAHLRADLASYEEACGWQGEFDYARHIIDDLDIIDPRRWRAKEGLQQ